MARRSPQTQEKRQREVAKADKRRAKAEKRALRKVLKSNDTEATGEDSATETAESDGSEDRLSGVR